MVLEFLRTTTILSSSFSFSASAAPAEAIGFCVAAAEPEPMEADAAGTWEPDEEPMGSEAEDSEAT
jgi:hypothetical protein